MDAGAVHVRSSLFDGAGLDIFLAEMRRLRNERAAVPLTVEAYDDMYVASLVLLAHERNATRRVVPQVLYVQALVEGNAAAAT